MCGGDIMGYKKVVVDGYILGVGVVEKGGNIDPTEYDRLSKILKEMPAAPDGFYYALRTDETWVLIEAKQEEDEPTAEEILDIIVGVSE